MNYSFTDKSFFDEFLTLFSTPKFKIIPYYRMFILGANSTKNLVLPSGNFLFANFLVVSNPAPISFTFSVNGTVFPELEAFTSAKNGTTEFFEIVGVFETILPFPSPPVVCTSYQLQMPALSSGLLIVQGFQVQKL